MRERVLAIVSFIAQYFLDDQDMMTESDLVEELLAVGFEADEIDAAFCWMESQTISSPAGNNITLGDPPVSHRVFSAEENRVISGDARGFLTRLRSMGILDTEVQEEVISKALQVAEDEISLKAVSYTHLTLPTTWSRCRSGWSRCD